MRPNLTVLSLVLATLVTSAEAGVADTTDSETPDSTYTQLISLFGEWRRFHLPPIVDGVYDYSPGAMSRQHRLLSGYFKRLSGIDTTGWSTSQRIDYHLVLAELNGLDFDHRVRRPWQRDPAFYVMLFPSRTDVVPREGPVIPNAIELWEYERPLNAEAASELTERMLKIPIQLDHAMLVLTANARDLWLAGIRRMKRQLEHLTQFAGEIDGENVSLSKAVDEAIVANQVFVRWLEREAVGKTGRSGIGVDNYTWYLQKVHLVAHSWEEQVTLVERELVRSVASLRLEEHRNRDLPPLEPIGSREDYDRAMTEAVREYVDFLEEREIMTVDDFVEKALLDRVGTFSHSDGPRSFFSEVNYRGPLIMRTHHQHWIDIARMKERPHDSPIRSTPLLSNIFDSRAEGLATGMEEMMMHDGLFDEKPPARELVWIMLAQRAARALAALRMHANQFSMEQAIDFAARWTPRGWLRAEGDLARSEQHLYLQQPGYGTSYVIGKLDIDDLLAEYAQQRGDNFELRTFMDSFSAAGVIPVSLIRFEMTGRDDRIRSMHTPR